MNAWRKPVMALAGLFADIAEGIGNVWSRIWR